MNSAWNHLDICDLNFMKTNKNYSNMCGLQPNILVQVFSCLPRVIAWWAIKTWWKEKVLSNFVKVEKKSNNLSLDGKKETGRAEKSKIRRR